jgi:hypothetical protein
MVLGLSEIPEFVHNHPIKSLTKTTELKGESQKCLGKQLHNFL